MIARFERALLKATLFKLENFQKSRRPNQTEYKPDNLRRKVLEYENFFFLHVWTSQHNR